MHDSDSHIDSILLVEDDVSLAGMVAEFLSQNGFDVTIDHHGESAVQRILERRPDAVVLDVNLPGRDGFSVCKAVRAAEYAGPIIMLTARGEEVDEVLGLEAGADDYMAKPVRPRALLTRLRSHLRRVTPDEKASDPIEVGSLTIEPARRRVEIDGEVIELTTAEFDLLYLLAQHAGKPLSRKEIYQVIHSMPYDGLDRSIDLRVSRLRKKLGDDPNQPRRIKSVRGVGYMLSAEP